MNVQELLARLQDRSPEQWLALASERLPFWVSLALVVAIGWYLARITWLVYPPPGEIGWEPPMAPSGSRPGNTSSGQDFNALMAAQLFGKAEAEPEPEPSGLSDQDVLEAPDTRLNLTLKAAVAASNPDEAHAIIADASGEEHVYFLRDSIPGGATLQQVRTDRVILSRGGTLEALRLPREFEDSAPAPTARRTGRRSASPTVQQVVQQNAATFTEVVRPQPFMPNGQLRGYRVYPGRNRQQFSALGLRPGDLVTAVNGISLTNPAEGMQIFRSLGDATQVNLTVERNGQSQNMTLDTSQLDPSLGGKR
ncbi:MAG: type II secretion system protein GspC [Chromatiales bacterium]|nr:MAG: type II secretion system protein GspC [Chromatiales bacterium]